MKTDNLKIKRDIERIRNLDEGWGYSGCGVEFDPDSLVWLQNALIRQVQKGLPIPSINPVQYGSVHLSWALPKDRLTTLEIDIEGKNKGGYWNERNQNGEFGAMFSPEGSPLSRLLNDSRRDLRCDDDSHWDFIRGRLVL